MVNINIISTIKQLKKIRLKHLKMLMNRLNREPDLFFHSHNKTLVEASRNHPINKTNQSQPTIIEIEKDLIDSLSIHENVISIPLESTDDWGVYSGGLINSRTHELIEEASHFRYGRLVQELPSFNEGTFGKDVPEIEDTVIFGGIIFSHFGHFLLESLGRLWAYEFFKELNPYICFYTPEKIPDYLGRNNFANQVLTGFGIPHKRVFFLNHLVRLKKVIVPQQKYGTIGDYSPHPVDPVFLNSVKNFRFKNDIPKGFENADKIYVSRTKMGIESGRIIAERIFEEYLKSNGYKILYPEFYTFFQQLTIYSNAKKIIFCSGSPVHTCILLPELQADVAIIARCQHPCDNLYMTMQFKGYGKTVLGVDALRGQYQFGEYFSFALSDVDWYEASIILKRQGFVDRPFDSFNQLDYYNLIRCELQSYIKAKLKSGNPKFIDFMMKLKEFKE